MPEPFTMEQATSKRLQRAAGVKEKDLKLLHLVNTVHGEGLYSHQAARREHVKAATIRQRISRARRKIKKKQMPGKL